MAVPMRLALLLTWASLASCFLTPLAPVFSPRGGTSGRVMGWSSGASSRQSRALCLVRMLGADDKVSVAVIGGGPAGLAAANTLLDVESVGSVTVIEKSEKFDDGPGTWGIGIGQRFQAILRNMTGNPWESSLAHTTLPGAAGFSRGTRPIIRRALSEALDAHPGAAGGRLRMEFGANVTRHDLENKMLTLNGGSGGVVPYDCLVLADGSHSSTVQALGRPRLGSNLRAFESCLKILPMPPTPNDTTTYVLKSEGTTGWLMSLKGGIRYMIFFFPLDPATGKNPGGVSSVAELRAFLANMTDAPVSAWAKNKGQEGEPEKLDLPRYWETVEDAALKDFVDRPPRVMWSGQRQSTVDEAGPVVLVGDAAGVCLPTLGQGTCMAIQDAANLKQSFLRAEEEVAARGGAKEDLVGRAMTLWRRDGEKERKAMVALNILVMAVRSRGWSRVPGLMKLSSWIGKSVEDPAVKLASVIRNPVVWVLSKLTMLLWVRSWGKDEEYVRRWRKGF